MKDRINQLESLVLGLMHQVTPRSGDQRSILDSSPAVIDSDQTIVATSETLDDVSPTPSDNGSIRIQEAVVSYVNSSHWAAILDSIADLRSHLAQEEEIHPQASDLLQSPAGFPKPQLLYGCLMYETLDSIIKSLPPRPVVDRLVARYFNLLDIAPGPGVVHSGHFLREYEEFWKAPTAAPIIWVGLLFFECFHLKDMEIGIWVLVGNIVQIAMHMGYHRDAKHFPTISPFAGEMRRRVWAMIVQLDFSISTQLGLPRLVKESQTNTAEPRNLYDSDFDENTTELPPSRPETEVTPTLYVLAKLRLLSVGVKVADVATEPRQHSYAQIMELDQRINEARNALPSSLKWDGISSSLNIPSQTIMQRIWLEVTAQQLKIVLHRKFIEPSRLQPHYGSSRSACFNAAMKILDLQRLVDEETQPDGLLYQSRWRVSSAFINDFLLATSILCFCLQNHDTGKQREELANLGDTKLESVDMEKVRQLLKTSQAIWGRQCDSSREARKAAAALRYVLGDSVVGSEPHIPEAVTTAAFTSGAAISYFPGRFHASYREYGVYGI
ncbi:hypothetical protein ONZ43_g3860 [Nemania bipapillata]|uniref:Uncharacterized protein n=1 Tax=Nemania bipapillata TaxID=110536 RepID=A0ACC2IV69_9PEZI|nr:hypothetical protein ONZ43_g3860 [Nemania bipapillata]